MEDEVDNAHDMVEQEESNGSNPSPLFSGTKPKRLRSKVWDDFTPIFIDGKVVKAECMHCHQVFNSSSSIGTSNLLKHQAKCSPRDQKRPTQQKLPFWPSTQKSMVAAGSDPTQKKLPFLPTSQKKCLGTTDAIHKKDLALPDIPKYTHWKSQDVDQNGSNEELATPEQKDLVLPDIPTDTNRKSQEVDQNGSHEELTIPEQKNLALPDIPIDKNTKDQSYEELALPEQDIPTDTSHKNQVVDQNGTHDELVRILAMHGYLPSMMHHGGFRKSVAFLNPMVKMSPYADLACNLMDLFDKEKAKLKEKFAALRSRVCLSAYVWHYDPLSPFLCLSVHYIDDEWERQQNIIIFHAMDPSCSAEELSDVILTAIGDWGLHGKVFSITLDDAFIDDSVASNVKAHLQKCNSPCANRSLFVVRYASHLLDQVIHVGLDELGKIMQKSANRSKYTKGPTPSAVQYPNYRYAPSSTDWSSARNICETMEDFHQYMDTMRILPGPIHQFDKLWDVNNDLHRIVNIYKDGTFCNVVKKMQQKFNKHWELCCLHLGMLIVMDPSYRLEHIRFRVKYGKREAYCREVHDILLSLFNEYSDQVEDLNRTSGSKTSKETVVNGNDMLLENYHHSEHPYNEPPMTELDQYLQEPRLSRGERSVLQWWKGHNLTYPTIARMARDILATPRSTDCKVATKSQVVNT